MEGELHTLPFDEVEESAPSAGCRQSGGLARDSTKFCTAQGAHQSSARLCQNPWGLYSRHSSRCGHLEGDPFEVLQALNEWRRPMVMIPGAVALAEAAADPEAGKSQRWVGHIFPGIESAGRERQGCRKAQID